MSGMFGVSDREATPARTIEQWSLTEIQNRANKNNIAYVASSKALAELMA